MPLPPLDTGAHAAAPQAPPVRLPTARAAGLAALLGALLMPPPAAAAELVVRVGALATGDGQVGCALFAGPDGFPMDNGRAQQQWQPASIGGISCRFEGLAAGRYAVAVSHDLNGNRRVDTNLFGIPTEAWGVSNNVRPMLRAPRFEEAAFTLGAEQSLTLDIQVAR